MIYMSASFELLPIDYYMQLFDKNEEKMNFQIIIHFDMLKTDKRDIK